ncbi:hypothetical protein ACR80S_03440 [Halomonas sp. MA07-2]|uniref:hypothetical protein n=1 Tax=Halomonas sp. MA07-2 TaxID=3440841 RepID=UPI003EEB2741
MPRLLIVKTGDAFPEVVEAHGDFETLFQQALARAGFSATVFDARHEPLPALEEIDGLYITGSHAMVRDAEPWSVQFHPEFTVEVMRAYLTRQVAALRDQAQDPEALIAGVTATPEASSLLARFAEAVARSDKTA